MPCMLDEKSRWAHRISSKRGMVRHFVSGLQSSENEEEGTAEVVTGTQGVGSGRLTERTGIGSDLES